jgi:hypothetical protein
MTKKQRKTYPMKCGKRNTFQLISMVTIPDKLGTKTNKFFHQRLKSNTDDKINIGKKFDSEKRMIRVLTSSIGGVAELPVKRLDSLPSSILALFGDGARGLPTGVGCPMSC